MKDIRTYNRKQLKELTPDVLSGFDGEIPITTPRIQSFINNPNIDDNDILLISYFKNNKLASYFGILPDYAVNGEKFYWNSGWRANNEIDKRAASIVFYKALSMYGDKLMLNHLTPHTKQIIDSTKVFNDIKALQGKKFFIKSILSEILIAKNPKLKTLKPLLYITDFSVNTILTLKKNQKSNKKITFEVLNSIDTHCELFINNNKTEILNNSIKNINHALDYKWLVSDNSFGIENDKYFFSLQSNTFKNYIIKLSINKNIIAIFHIVNRNSNFKLYYSYFNNNFLNDIAKELYIFLQKNNAKTFLSFDTILNSELTKQKYLFVKDTVQFYTYSKQLKHLFNNKHKYQAGFGDVIYT